MIMKNFKPGKVTFEFFDKNNCYEVIYLERSKQAKLVAEIYKNKIYVAAYVYTGFLNGSKTAAFKLLKKHYEKTNN